MSVCFCHVTRRSLFGIVSFFFFKQKTAYEMRISDWSSDVCSSDLCCWASIGWKWAAACWLAWVLWCWPCCLTGSRSLMGTVYAKEASDEQDRGQEHLQGLRSASSQMAVGRTRRHEQGRAAGQERPQNGRASSRARGWQKV